MRYKFASLSVDIAYNSDKSVVIRRFPTEYETTELKKSKYKLVDEEAYTSDNHLELILYYNTRRKHVDVISGGNYNFKEGGRYGVDINLNIKKAEQDLIEYLSDIIRDLCRMHLKPCVLFPSRHSINCEIDECKLTEDKVKIFIQDFVTTLERDIKDFKVRKIEKKIEEEVDKKVRQREEYENKYVCSDCGKQFDYDTREYWYDKKLGTSIYLCPACWNIRRKKMSKTF